MYNAGPVCPQDSDDEDVLETNAVPGTEHAQASSYTETRADGGYTSDDSYSGFSTGAGDLLSRMDHDMGGYAAELSGRQESRGVGTQVIPDVPGRQPDAVTASRAASGARSSSARTTNTRLRQHTLHGVPIDLEHDQRRPKRRRLHGGSARSTGADVSDGMCPPTQRTPHRRPPRPGARPRGGMASSDAVRGDPDQQQGSSVVAGIELADSEALHDDGPEYVPLYDTDDWGQADSALDSFCFMCEYRERGSRELSNPWFQKLATLIEDGKNLHLHTLCSMIKRFYDEKLKRFEAHQRPWTMRSIERHMTEHGGLNSDGCMTYLMRMQFCVAYRLAKNELIMKPPDGKPVVNIPALASISKLVQQYIQLDRVQKSNSK